MIHSPLIIPTGATMKNLPKNISQNVTKIGFSLLLGFISTFTLADEPLQTAPVQAAQPTVQQQAIQQTVPQGVEQPLEEPALTIEQSKQPIIEQPKQIVEQPKIVQPQANNVEKTAPLPNNTALNPNLLNINNASAAEIQDKLIGIGAKKAQAIVDYREKNGKFIALEQLTEVSGIGKATLEKNRDRIILE